MNINDIVSMWSLGVDNRLNNNHKPQSTNNIRHTLIINNRANEIS